MEENTSKIFIPAKVSKPDKGHYGSGAHLAKSEILIWIRQKDSGSQDGNTWKTYNSTGQVMGAVLG